MAVRELKEETGIEHKSLNIVLSHELPTRAYEKQKKELHSFLLVTNTDLSSHQFTCNMVDGRDFYENDKWNWFTLSEASLVVHATQRANLDIIADLAHRLV